MRRLVLLTIFVALSCPAFCSTDARTITLEEISMLQSRAEHAQPEEQCFLYAQIIAGMSQEVDRQLAAGDSAKAAAALERMQAYAVRIHSSVGVKTKRIKDTEILIRETARHMEAMVRHADIEDQDMLHSALGKLNMLQADLMLHVFQH
jgi:hypothetical protein